MVVSTFSVLNQNGKERILDESILLANVMSDIVINIYLWIMSNADVIFKLATYNRSLMPLKTYSQPPEVSS